jgi:hypothetical protein
MFTEPVRVIDLGVFLDQAAYPPWEERRMGAPRRACSGNSLPYRDMEIKAEVNKS